MLLSNSEFVSGSNIAVPTSVKTGGTGGFRRIYARRFKRTVDLSLTLALVLLTAPVLIPILVISMLLVALDGHSPLYRQARIGRNGRIYQMLKIRTMVNNAEARLIDYLAANPEAKAEWDCHQKLRNDPRITPVGRFLRKTSLDELPQLWNVIRGDMSLIGPRPMMVDQAKLYPGHAYYDLRPGITGPWQVSDRNHSSFADRARFDDSYRENLSFTSDIKLLARTAGVVLRGTGC